MLKPVSIPLCILSILLNACNKTNKNEAAAEQPQGEDKLEVRIEVVPDIKPGEENMSQEDRMMKRFNETKTIVVDHEELKKQINNATEWEATDQATMEDLKRIVNSKEQEASSTKTEQLLKQEILKQLNKTNQSKETKLENKSQ